jgi:hypothetical protein
VNSSDTVYFTGMIDNAALYSVHLLSVFVFQLLISGEMHVVLFRAIMQVGHSAYPQVHALMLFNQRIRDRR